MWGVAIILFRQGCSTNAHYATTNIEPKLSALGTLLLDVAAYALLNLA